MITSNEKAELMALHKRLGELLPKLECVATCCRTCGSYRGGYCGKYECDVPAEFESKGCEHWYYDDIPF